MCVLCKNKKALHSHLFAYIQQIEVVGFFMVFICKECCIHKSVE